MDLTKFAIYYFETLTEKEGAYISIDTHMCRNNMLDEISIR